MRRLVLSDTHFGMRGALASHPEALERLDSELAWADEVVLNGDIFSVMVAGWQLPVRAARPLLDRIADHVDSVLFVPGNHDHHLLVMDGELAQAAEAVGGTAPVGRPWLTGWLRRLFGGADVRVEYPFAVRDGVSFCHGHQAELLLAGRGVPPLDVRRWQRIAQGSVSSLPADEYERRLAPLYEALYQLLGTEPGTHSLSMARAARAMLYAGGAPSAAARLAVGQAVSRRLGLKMRLKPEAATVAALAQVCADLGVPSGSVCVAHTHVPTAGQRAVGRADWSLFNSGSWIYNRRLQAAYPAERWSRPGHVLRVENGSVTLHDLLADVSLARLDAWAEEAWRAAST